MRTDNRQFSIRKAHLSFQLRRDKEGEIESTWRIQICMLQENTWLYKIKIWFNLIQLLTKFKGNTGLTSPDEQYQRSKLWVKRSHLRPENYFATRDKNQVPFSRLEKIRASDRIFFMIRTGSFNKYSSVSVNTMLRIKMAEKRGLEHFGFTTTLLKKNYNL